MRGLIGSVRGIMSPIYNSVREESTKQLLEELDRSVANLVEYNASFEQIISQNAQRELKPIHLIETINRFCKSVSRDSSKRSINIKTQYYNHNFLVTLPMHESEWHTILLNLYTNARKAIKRANHKGEIYIIAGKFEEKIYVEFMDNGDGIKEEYRDRIFDAFFTTSIPTSVGTVYDDLIGSGLGLKIVRDILASYKGNIFIDDPETEYKTCFRIEITPATEQQLKEYGY
jgi:signal transduction histidine kinase